MSERSRPCGTCPWRVGADPARIPGFDIDQARGLASTCPDSSSGMSGPLMSCHVSHEGNDWVCLGWALSPASRDSIPLRLAMSSGIVAPWPHGPNLRKPENPTDTTFTSRTPKWSTRWRNSYEL